ncbi:MAG: smalltalk protein [Prevotella sp.]|jgi:hypothetical protein|nr:smalltalk protein [Prevotella sp. E13-27]MBQ7661822.1 smalltalk protein [Prevotella sp.]MBR4565888.1 smalltalk protein [Prevotella sp.]MCK8621592.1 smalltalk protein [Prevotella sp. E13-27]
MADNKNSNTWGILMKVIIAIASALLGVLGGVEASTLLQ